MTQSTIDSEVLAKLKSILDQAEPYMKHGVEEDWQAFIATVQSIPALFQAREQHPSTSRGYLMGYKAGQQQLLTELLGEADDHYNGFGKVVPVSVIERKIGELNG